MPPAPIVPAHTPFLQNPDSYTSQMLWSEALGEIYPSPKKVKSAIINLKEIVSLLPHSSSKEPPLKEDCISLNSDHPLFIIYKDTQTSLLVQETPSPNKVAQVAESPSQNALYWEHLLCGKKWEAEQQHTHSSGHNWMHNSPQYVHMILRGMQLQLGVL